jgi:ABC-2 type transport system ATP-binding protein
MKQLAREGRTVFVSSHLMNEMAVTADHLIVIGRGKLIADCSTQEFIERSSEKFVLVRSPQAARLADLVAGAGGKAEVDEAGGSQAGTLKVTGLDAPHVGEIAAAERIVLHELTPRLASLEEAYMELTADSLEYGVHGSGPAAGSGASVPGEATQPAQPAASGPASASTPGRTE